MICEDSFVFRKGKKGDKPPSCYIPIDENDLPAFVLELSNKQVASACTMSGDNHIFMISSFVGVKCIARNFLSCGKNMQEITDIQS